MILPFFGVIGNLLESPICRRIIDMSTSIMQTRGWGDFKAVFSWKAHQALGLFVLERKVNFGRSFLYIPEITYKNNESFSALAARSQAALSHLKSAKTIFGRAEFLIPYSPESNNALISAGFIKSVDEVQPEWRQEVDLRSSIDEIKLQMKQKGRYNVGLAARHGVVVEEDESSEAINCFAELIHNTARRQKFVGRGKEYYAKLIHFLVEEKTGGLWVARYHGNILAGAIMAFYGDRASYLYGASSDQDRSVMAPHLLHFTLMKEAKQRGCQVYDLIGVAPTDAKKHPWSGITRFKKEFGGETVHYLGSYDRVYSPGWYSLYKMARRK